jgi:hypothetical protein
VGQAAEARVVVLEEAETHHQLRQVKEITEVALLQLAVVEVAAQVRLGELVQLTQVEMAAMGHLLPLVEVLLLMLAEEVLQHMAAVLLLVLEELAAVVTAQ